MFQERARKRLSKKAKKGFRGFPVATVAFYGPDDRRASKVAVSVHPRLLQSPAPHWVCQAGLNEGEARHALAQAVYDTGRDGLPIARSRTRSIAPPG